MRRLLAGAAVIAVAALVAVGLLQHEEPAWWIRLWYPLSYREAIVTSSHSRRLDPALVAAVIYEESRFRPSTTSSVGAIGLMQLLPSTAKGIAERTGGTAFRTSDLYQPDVNIRYGTWYLADLVHRYRGHRDDITLALAAYNAGSANVDRWISQTQPGHAVRIPFPATRSYVAGVLHVQTLYRKAYGASLGPP